MPMACCCGGHPAPDCCAFGGCCFDTANGVFSGHVSLIAEFYASADCTGSPLHTIELSYDFILPLSVFGDTCGSAGYDSLTGTVANTAAVFTNLILTLDGVDLCVPSVVGTPPTLSCGAGIDPVTGNSDQATLDVNFTRTAGGKWSTSTGLTIVLDFANTNIFAIEDLSDILGDCLGITPIVARTFCGPFYGATTLNSYHTEWDMSMNVGNNVCCKSGGVCVAGASVLTRGDGVCGP